MYFSRKVTLPERLELESDLIFTTAIIGLGKIGLKYDLDSNANWKPNQIMTHCRAVSKSKDFTLTYLIDSNIENLKLAASLFPDTPCLIEAEALKLPSPEFVIVSVPTEFHLEVVKKICENWRPRSLLVEKPFGINSFQAQEMHSLLSSALVTTYINYFRRHLPHIRQLLGLEILETAGNVKTITITGYGSLINIFSHFLDLGIFILGKECFGVNRKEILFQVGDRVVFLDPITGIRFDLSGIGDNPQSCEMTIEFEELNLCILNNGQKIEIYNFDSKLIWASACEIENFMSYQTEVLSQIVNNRNMSDHNKSIEDAIHVHKFIESVGFLYA
jgi:predicted dehydrogenase